MKHSILAVVLCACVGNGARSVARMQRHHSAMSATHALDVSDADCVSWLSARRTWTAVGVVLASVTAGAAPVRELLPDTDATRISFGVGALVTGGIAALASSLAGGFATDFGRYCTTIEPPPGDP